MSRKGLWGLVIVSLSFYAVAFSFVPEGVKIESVADFRVGNLTCGACVEKVREAVQGLDGNAEVKVDLQTGLARVIYDESRTDATAIAHRITQAGYPAVVAGPSAVPVSAGSGCPAARQVRNSGCGGSCCG